MLRPMEILQVIYHGHINSSEVDLNDNFDKEYKPEYTDKQNHLCKEITVDYVL